MLWYFYDITNERHKDILIHSIEKFDSDNKIHLQNVLTEEEFVSNYNKLKLDILVLNFNERFIKRIRNENLKMIIICKDFFEIEKCNTILEKSISPNNAMVLVSTEFSSTELIYNFMNLKEELL